MTDLAAMTEGTVEFSQLVRGALDDLLSESGVKPGEPEAVAGHRVLSFLWRSGVRGGLSDPVGCVLANWLRARLAPLPVMVSATRVIAPAGRQADGGVRLAVVELPACVRYAVSDTASQRALGLIDDAA